MIVQLSHFTLYIFRINSINLCKALGYKCGFLTRSSQQEKVIHHFVQSHEATHFTLDGESLGLTYQDFSDLCEDRLLTGCRPVIIKIPDNTSFLVYINKVSDFMSWSCLQMDNFTKTYESEFNVVGRQEKVVDL